MIILAAGWPGTGKTTLFHDLVWAQCDAQLFFVKAHDHSWDPDDPRWRGRPPRVYFVAPGATAAQWKDIRAGVYVFKPPWTGQQVAQLAIEVGGVTVVDDEIDKAGRRRGFDDEALRDILNEGRHLLNAWGQETEVNILGACRRPQKLHSDFEMFAEFYVFRTTGKRALDRLVDDEVISDEQRDIIRTLPNLTFWHWPSMKYLSLQPLKQAGK